MFSYKWISTRCSLSVETLNIGLRQWFSRKLLVVSLSTRLSWVRRCFQKLITDIVAIIVVNPEIHRLYKPSPNGLFWCFPHDWFWQWSRLQSAGLCQKGCQEVVWITWKCVPVSQWFGTVMTIWVARICGIYCTGVQCWAPINRGMVMNPSIIMESHIRKDSENGWLQKQVSNWPPHWLLSEAIKWCAAKNKKCLLCRGMLEPLRSLKIRTGR